MSPVKLVAGTDSRDGVEVTIEVDAFGYRPIVDFIIEALSNYGKEDGEVQLLDFVLEVTTFDIPEEGNFMDYQVNHEPSN